MPQPAKLLNSLANETLKIKKDATVNGVFRFELVNEIRLQAVFRKLNKLAKSRISDLMHNLYGRIHALRNNEGKARIDHLKSITAEPNCAMHCTDYAVTMELFGHFAEAVEYHRAALKIAPDDKLSWQSLIKDLIIIKSYEKALEAVDKLLKLESSKDNKILKEFILELHYPSEDKISDETLDLLDESDKDIAKGRVDSFANIDEAVDHLDTLMNV